MVWVGLVKGGSKGVGEEWLGECVRVWLEEDVKGCVQGVCVRVCERA